MSGIPKKLEAAMRFVYGHFIGSDESIDTWMTSRRVPAANIRHITRKLLLMRYACNYYDIVEAECAICDALEKNHSRVSHSVHKAREKYESYDEGRRIIKNLLDEFETYCMELEDPAHTRRLAFYANMPGHQLALMLYFVELNGWVDPVRLEGLHTEFKTATEQFVKEKIDG